MNIIHWFHESHRWQHLSGGILIWLLSLGCWYAAMLAGVGIASALEYKDKSWGGLWDWNDWVITIAGAAGGFGISFTMNGTTRALTLPNGTAVTAAELLNVGNILVFNDRTRGLLTLMSRTTE